jgi:cation transport protein ChaC
MDILWRREMVNNSYDPRWVSVHTDDGVKKAISFVIRHDSPGFAKRMSDEAVAEIIARATGFLGPCCHYLFKTADALTKAGISDENLNRLVIMVKRCQAEG